MKHEDQKAIRKLYRQTRTEQPSSELDQRIRIAAHDDIATKKPNWVWSLSTAAVILLSVNVVLNVYDPDQDETAILFEEIRKKPAEQSQGQSYDFAPADSSSDAQFIDTMKPIVRKDSAPFLAPQSVMPEVSIEAKSVQESEERLPVIRKDTEIRPQSIKSEGVEKKKRSSRLFLDESKEQQSKSSSSVDRQYTAPKSLGLGQAPVQSRAVEKAAVYRFVTPHLPTSPESLLKLDTSLTVEQDDDSLILIYRNSHLILTVQTLSDTYLFEAYRGSELIGVEMEWSLTPATLGNHCLLQDSITRCALNETSDAYFEGEHLIYIRWTQTEQ